MVVHDSIKEVANKLDIISDLGYKFINHFMLSDDAWRIPFEHLERLINNLRKRAKSTKPKHSRKLPKRSEHV